MKRSPDTSALIRRATRWATVGTSCCPASERRNELSHQIGVIWELRGRGVPVPEIRSRTYGPRRAFDHLLQHGVAAPAGVVLAAAGAMAFTMTQGRLADLTQAALAVALVGVALALVQRGGEAPGGGCAVRLHTPSPANTRRLRRRAGLVSVLLALTAAQFKIDGPFDGMTVAGTLVTAAGMAGVAWSVEGGRSAIRAAFGAAAVGAALVCLGDGGWSLFYAPDIVQRVGALVTSTGAGLFALTYRSAAQAYSTQDPPGGEIRHPSAA